MEQIDAMDGCSDNLIVIGQDEFRRRWNMLQAVPVMPACLKKAEHLREDYACFRFKSQSNPARGAPKYKRDTPTQKSVEEYPSAKSMRPRIGVLFTNTEGKARKNFVAFMNKLSPQNKDDILNNFIRSLVPENIDIYMDQIMMLFQVQPTYHDLYMEVLNHIIAISPERARGFVQERFSTFLSQSGHLVPDAILGCINNDEAGESTDQLCEYTKWKKQTKSIIVL